MVRTAIIQGELAAAASTRLAIIYERIGAPYPGFLVSAFNSGANAAPASVQVLSLQTLMLAVLALNNRQYSITH